MVTVGVTGGIGSGKTTVCQFLDELGAEVVYADDVAKRLMVEDHELRQAITDEFGPQSYHSDGSLNREYLAEEVFGNPDKLQRLNQLVHPRTLEVFHDHRKNAAARNVEVLVHEAALIFESGGDKQLDLVIVVDAPEDQRIHRVVQRDDVTPSQVQQRMGHQLSSKEMRRRADYVIENTGTLDDLREKVEQLYTTLKARA